MLLMQAVAIVTLRSQVIGLLLVSVLCLLCWVLGCWVACAFVIVPIPKTTQPFVFNCCCFNCCHCCNVPTCQLLVAFETLQWVFMLRVMDWCIYNSTKNPLATIGYHQLLYITVTFLFTVLLFFMFFYGHFRYIFVVFPLFANIAIIDLNVAMLFIYYCYSRVSLYDIIYS